MKRIRIFLTTLLCALAFTNYAQEAESRIAVPLNEINTIVLLNLDGNSTIVESGSDILIIKSELTTNGDSWGWRFPESRPEFKIDSKQSNDTLYVSTPVAFDFKIVGISTYKELVSTVIQIPENIKLVIRKADILTIESNFQDLRIYSSNEIDYQNIDKKKLGSLICQSGARLTVNGVTRKLSYEFQGDGLRKYSLEAEVITLNTK